MSRVELENANYRAGRNTSVRFSIQDSNSSSATSSRSSSPARSDDRQLAFNEKYPYGTTTTVTTTYGASPLANAINPSVEDMTPGRMPMDVYEATLPKWRAGMRRWLLKIVQRESYVIAKMQDKIRTPWLDAYFVYTSTLGTHTFFMILLPAFFFFGYGELGRGLLMVLALGVYFSSVIKDLICSPRPIAPPVTRLTIGSHHLEYGFPSTHSTNSVSIALFFYSLVHQLATTVPPTSSPAAAAGHIPYLNDTLSNTTITTTNTGAAIPSTISPMTYTLLTILLGIYTFSIVFGRLYTAMHSFIDCLCGIILGTAIWWGQTSWPGIPLSLSWTSSLPILSSLFPTHTINLGAGLGLGARVEAWVGSAGWEVPLILIPGCLFLVHQHPQPVDDCPCFEDAIAFGSVVLGALVGRWGMNYAGIGVGLLGRVVVMPGSGWVVAGNGEWVQVERGWDDVGLWWAVAGLKMAVGILTIFVWRILAKSLLHLVLPPTFRLLARAFRLPHRRFYTPATEYKSVPSEFHSPNGFGLHPIPSVIDLPGTAGVGVEVGGIGSGVDGMQYSAHRMGDVKMRGGSKEVVGASEKAELKEADKGLRADKEGQPVNHYDADVLTKVIVYAGIAILATELVPFMFEVVGWGVQSWV